MIARLLEMLMGAVFDFLDGFFGIFPEMPDIAEVWQEGAGPIVTEVFGWVNYFLPLDVASAIVAVWSTSIMAYVGVKLAMKYARDIA